MTLSSTLAPPTTNNAWAAYWSRHAETFFLRGEHVTLLRWIGVLSDEQRQARPALGILQAIMFSAAGLNREAALALREVDQALSNLDEHLAQNRELLGRAAAAHAMVATAHEDPQTILQFARRSLEFASDESGWHSSVLLASSNAYFLLGDLAACAAALSKGIEIATLRQSHMLVLIERAKLAQTYWMLGHLQQAAQSLPGRAALYRPMESGALTEQRSHPPDVGRDPVRAR